MNKTEKPPAAHCVLKFSVIMVLET